MRITATKKEIEDGAKAAYAALFTDPENWPVTSCSHDADRFRLAAKACIIAAKKAKNG